MVQGNERDYGNELDELKAQMKELQQLVQQLCTPSSMSSNMLLPHDTHSDHSLEPAEQQESVVYYSGQYRSEKSHYRWESQARTLHQLLEQDGEKMARVLGALGHKQRVDILRSLMIQPMSGPELVERLNMGTTGQLYHHIKALIGADLLLQEERGGKYAVTAHRALPLLLLFTGAAELFDASDYMEMTDARKHPEQYLGDKGDGVDLEGYDRHMLLRAVVENCILEHQAGYCTDIGIFQHEDGSITVADNGRGIPAVALSHMYKSRIQDVLTNMGHLNPSAAYVAPGSEKGITMSVVNALSRKLSVEIRRDGKVMRQEYSLGHPHTELRTIGVTQETGTSITFQPDHQLFGNIGFIPDILCQYADEIMSAYPGLTVNVY
ncbi:ATP-binding protein [Paenibacillus marinisediminis]